MKELIGKVVDEGDFFEIQESYAKNIVTAFARIEGTDGGHRGQPADGPGRRARFRRFAKGGAFREVLRRVQHPARDVRGCPGFLPGTAQEYGGLIKHGAKLLFAYAEATVPLVTIITRKAFGGAYDVMASKHIGGGCELCVADGADRRDGREGRGGDHLPARTSATPRRSRRAPRNTRSASCRPSSLPSAAISTRSSCRIRRAGAWRGPSPCCAKSELEQPWRKHDNLPL